MKITKRPECVQPIRCLVSEMCEARISYRIVTDRIVSHRTVSYHIEIRPFQKSVWSLVSRLEHVAPALVRHLFTILPYV